ncbi:MAG: hypothetical protein VX640_01655 [Pseudomonadota bacterium]|nr:hypothetical protein [Pseudomonadota bacterium]
MSAPQRMEALKTYDVIVIGGGHAREGAQVMILRARPGEARAEAF